MTLNLDKLQSQIMDIGNDMVQCSLHCKGVDLVPDEGKFPRALHLEFDQGNDNGRGVVVVGLNPGRARQWEKNFYNEVGRTFEHVVELWNKDKRAHLHPYHRQIRIMVRAWGFEGPILWSELAKCQTKASVQTLPLQTFRTCVDRFLSREMKLIPDDWPILAAGQESYKAVSYLFSDRGVIGIPHPTGAHITQRQRCQMASADAKAVANRLWEDGLPVTVWLPDKLEGYYDRH